MGDLLNRHFCRWRFARDYFFFSLLSLQGRWIFFFFFWREGGVECLCMRFLPLVQISRLLKLPHSRNTLMPFTTVSILYFSMYFSVYFSLVRTVEQTSLSENVCEVDFLCSINQLDEKSIVRRWRHILACREI